MPALTWRGERITFDSYEDVAIRGSRGASWYLDSGDALASYAHKLGTSSKRVCDIVAILSPRVSTVQNMRLAQHYLERGTFRQGTMKARASAVLRYEDTGVFTGPKVVAFSRALQGDGDAVVIDAWIARLFDIAAESLTLGRYRETAERVRRVAHSVGLLPAEAQACLWVGTRELVGYLDPVATLEVM
jgi:hypothetical protein